MSFNSNLDFSDSFEEKGEYEYYSQLINSCSLPPNHKPARGRGRSLQLSKMTEKQKKEEKLIRLERNRLAAKDCRIKKKRKLNEMEERISYLESIISSRDQGVEFIEELKKKEERIEILEGVVSNQSEAIQRLLENTNPV